MDQDLQPDHSTDSPKSFLTNVRTWKIATICLLLFFYGWTVTSSLTLPAALDLPRQMSNGKEIFQGNFDVLTKNVYSYIEPNQPFANHHWLSGVVYYVLYKAIGWTGLTIFKSLFFLGIFSLLFYLSVKKANFWLVAVLSVPTIMILAGRVGLRPEMFSYAFVVIYLYLFYLFEKDSKKNHIYWLIPLQILWTNMHLFFPMGLLLTGGFLMEKLWLYRSNLQRNRVLIKLSIVLFAQTIAIFVNPFGLKGAIYSLLVNTSKTFPIGSAEVISWAQALKAGDLSFVSAVIVFKLLLVILAISFLVAFANRKQNYFYFIVGLATAIAGLLVVRSLPLFALIFLPAASFNLNHLWLVAGTKISKLFRIEISGSLVSAAFFACLVGFVFYLYSTHYFPRVGIGLMRNSTSSADFFIENNLHGPIFNDTDIGSYLIYYLYPKEQVITDNRFGDAYSAAFFRDIFLPMAQDEKAWKAGLERYKFNTIFFYQYDQGPGARDFLHRRINDPEWAWVYADDFAVILVRNISENQELINQYRITWDNMATRFGSYIGSKSVDDNIIAADLYNLVGNIDMAMQGYMHAVTKNPRAGKIWFILGQLRLDNYGSNSTTATTNSILALIYLQRAIEEGYKAAEVYSYLALAYYRLERFDEAEAAVEKELEIYPESSDGKQWVGLIAKGRQQQSANLAK